MLIALAFVISLGFLPAAGTPVASAYDSTEDVKVDGAGMLTAEGDGIAVLGGRGIVKVRGNGILWINDRSGNAEIRVTGYGQKKEFSDGWVQYAGFHGRAEVKGSRIIVVIAGVDVDLEARGRGRAILWGHGHYEIGGQTDEWSTGLGTRLKFANADVVESE